MTGFPWIWVPSLTPPPLSLAVFVVGSMPLCILLFDRINLMTMFERRHSCSHTTFGNICLRLKHCCCCYLWLFAFVRSFLLLHLFHCHLYIIFSIQPANINSEMKFQCEWFVVCARIMNQPKICSLWNGCCCSGCCARCYTLCARIKTMWFFSSSLVLFGILYFFLFRSNFFCC